MLDETQKLTVMISSTVMDLPEHRQRLMDACLRQSMFPRMMEHLPARDADAINTSMAMVDEADVYIGVFGFRYGYVPKGHRVSITEMEYNRVIKRKIPRLLFLMHDSHPLIAADVETGKGAVKLKAFRDRLSKDRVVGFFRSPDDLAARAIEALLEYRKVPSQTDLRKSEITSVFYRVAVMNKSSAIDDSEAKKVVEAIQRQVHRDFAPAWGIDAELTFVARGAQPPPNSWWLMLLDHTDRAGALGYRESNSEGLPLGKIFVRSATDANASWTVTASHILLELLANPSANLTIFQPAGEKGARFFAYEVCNACEAEEFSYEVEGVRLSDFVLPSWFESFREPERTKFDFCGHINAPYQILRGGYALFYGAQSNRGWQTVFASDRPRDALSGNEDRENGKKKGRKRKV